MTIDSERTNSSSISPKNSNFLAQVEFRKLDLNGDNRSNFLSKKNTNEKA
jgi:hypothetical protein